LIEIAKLKGIKFFKVPPNYTNNINSPTTIIESQLANFMKDEEFREKNYITKSHYFKKNTLQRKYPDHVKFIFIERDVKDAIVSHYFHIKNRFSEKITFSQYFFCFGRLKYFEIYLYNKRCKKFMGEDHFINYCDLKSNFIDVVCKLCDIIGVDNISRSEIMKIKEETTIDKLREKLKKGDVQYYPENKSNNWKLFRKGELGNWKDYFSEKQLDTIENIENDKDTFFIKTAYFILFTLRREIFKVE